MEKISCCLFLLIAGLYSCKEPSSLNKQEYFDYFQSSESPVFKQRTVSDVNYKLKMQPPEYLILKDNAAIDEKEYNEVLEKKSGQMNFVLLMEDEQGSSHVKQLIFNPELYSQLVEYANTELIKHIKLVNGEKVLDCSLVHLEPANSVQPVIRMAFVFNHCDRSKEHTVIFDDHFFNNGEIKFQYTEDQLNQLPHLKF